MRSESRVELLQTSFVCYLMFISGSIYVPMFVYFGFWIEQSSRLGNVNEHVNILLSFWRVIIVIAFDFVFFFILRGSFQHAEESKIDS